MHALLEDLRRHLLWSEGESGTTLLVDRAVARALRSAAAPPARVTPSASAQPVRNTETSSLRERFFGPPAPATGPQGHTGKHLPLTPSGKVTIASRPLDEIRRELGDCRRCKLCEGRRNIVFGVGNPRAELVFVGEGPGAEEDAQGVPFVGAAGQLLTKMIEAMGFRRDDVYICNVVKCRPTGNRNPEPDEIQACEPFLTAQLASLKPKVIVALGKFAAQTLLRDTTPITRLRGQWREYQGIRLMPTFHPAYLLRNPAEKKSAWQDLQQVMKIFGKAPQGK
ncbi:MAG: uracil-DNA glycosylase [Myxococcaceae bacterium]|nr:uracil-DNA glycosylase [Myxococcaceae bacterium]